MGHTSIRGAKGWGKDIWGKQGKYQVILKKVDLPIVPRQPCVERLRKTRLGLHFNLHSSFICAGKFRISINNLSRIDSN